MAETLEPQDEPQELDTSTDYSLEAVEAQFGPFDPPPEFDVGAEFHDDPPRSVPPELRQGLFEQRRRKNLYTTAVLGVGCILFASHSLVSNLAYYVLVLGYLDWIGYGILALTAVGAILHFGRPGPYAYVRDGIAVAGRVLGVDRYYCGTKEAPRFGYAVTVEYPDPQAGELRAAQTFTEEIGDANSADRYSTPLTPGDYVTVVGMPGRFDETLRVYGYLGLNPDLQFVLKDGKPLRPLPTYAVLLIAIVVVALLALLLFAIDALYFRMPLEWNFGVVLVGAGVGLAACVALAEVLRRSRKDAKGSARPAGAWLVGGLIGLFAGVVATVSLNTWLDGSTGTYRDLRVVNFWQTTWTPLFIRQYRIEARDLADDTKHEFPARIERMAEFESTMAGAMEIGEGAFGMKWVRDVHPAVFVPVAEDEDPTEAMFSARIVDEGSNNVQEVNLKLMLKIGDNEYSKPSDALVQLVQENLETPD